MAFATLLEDIGVFFFSGKYRCRKRNFRYYNNNVSSSNNIILFVLFITASLFWITTTTTTAADQAVDPDGTSITGGLSHRHRLHHGGHPRPRSRRYGETSPPIISFEQTQLTENPSYKVDDSSLQGHQNLHKPVFFDCANYRPETYEGQPKETKVIQVEASDDDPKESGGTITYSIVSNDQTQDAFAIHPHTGWLTTRKVFDRDEPAREKEVYVTVRATDNGRPQLDAVCTMKVKILDINDNRPMFDKYEYKESIPRDQAVGQVVTRISATDIDDGNNGSIFYSLEPHPADPSDTEYFDIESQSGTVKLKKLIPETKYRFYVTAVATDRGNPPSEPAKTELSVGVVDPNKKPPTFVTNFKRRITLSERHRDKTSELIRIEANANSEDGILFFDLISGQTEPTNKGKVFTLEQAGSSNVALLKLDKDLDYESVSEYTLTIRATNKYNLAAETVITVEVEDENDEKPTFREVYTGSVLENENPGTFVMRVQAIDLDGTSPNNEVTLHLRPEDEENFQIDSKTGDIRTRKKFDREEKDIYQLTVIAQDGAPSALSNNGQHNERPVTLKIEIADKNDNSPAFLKQEYRAEINEDANINAKVVEIKAVDDDTASVLNYTIADGNVGDAFDIWPESGIIAVKNSLDYEKHRRYELTIRVSDSVYNATTRVIVDVMNINDNPPVFKDIVTNKTIQEETTPSGCIFEVAAYDPDIEDRNQPQNISYFIESGEDHFTVDNSGCVRVIKPLDRDGGTGGYPWKTLRVGAKDEWGASPTSLIGYQDLTVTLTDINDNAPFLNSTNPVVWLENRPRGVVTTLSADDYDLEKNGPPFSFHIDPNVNDNEIRTYFSIQDKRLYADKDNFDRERRKQYLIPIVISDSGIPPQTGTSTLTVIIGDENDNDMKNGSSKIFVYKYKPQSTFPIGRVYVDDADDWDLPDKHFSWESPNPHPKFNLDPDSGDINMYQDTPEGVYPLQFTVKDMKWNSQVHALVEVTVKTIPQEAIIQSGSIRFMGMTKEQFIKVDAKGNSHHSRLRTEIAKLFGLNENNVDVFTVINSPHNHDLSVVDVRYSAHGSPYYKAEKLDGIIGQNKAKLEGALQLNIMMIRIDECISEKQNCESSCFNNLTYSDIPYKIATNTSSFVGVNAYVDPICACSSAISPIPSSCLPNPCLNKGTCRSSGGVQTCECPPGLDGPFCEDISIAFDRQSYAWYPPLSVCNDSRLEFEINTNAKNSLIMYNGPIYKSPMNITDFMSIELRKGQPLLLIDYGSGVTRISIPKSPDLADGKSHKISVRWSPNKISLQVDECVHRGESCLSVSSPTGPNSFLNVNGPLQLGGMSFDPIGLKSDMKWSYIPTREKFFGCVSNFTFNGAFYNLGEPSFHVGNVTSCDAPRPDVQLATLGVDFNFVVILLVCILILLILVISIVYYRRKKSYEEVKGDPHDDVRENIINYSDEGGGEGDQTGYDLSVLMKPTSNGPFIHSPTDKVPMDDLRQGRAPEPGDGPDIQSFLQGNKNKVDNDPDGLPYDDVRNYAYEGDGNSVGSLSSLASGTDDGDLNFDYLPAFGPRFKKLADMYGGQSSDDESYSGPHAPPEAWC